MMSATTLEPTTEETLPARRRRLVFGRPAMALTAVLILALGFIAGVEVQKNQGSAASATATASAARAGGFAGRGGFPLGGGPGGGAAAGDVVTGTVANKNGRYIYVKDADGNTIRVKTTSNSTISRNAKAHTASIHPGDTVVIQGSKSKDGTVTATRVNATAQGVSAGGFGGGGFGGGGFGGGGGGGAPAPAAGASTGAPASG
jgi:hypothetical protein